jgi:hypothetical protein
VASFAKLKSFSNFALFKVFMVQMIVFVVNKKTVKLMLIGCDVILPILSICAMCLRRVFEISRLSMVMH